MTDGFTPPDQETRDRILNDLDRTLLVEAAAGTGKTTSMVGRLVGLLACGRCRVEEVAAITFTRKAASELRDRFHTALVRKAAAAEGHERLRLQEAAEHVDRAFIGTIHSFCARLLRERPVEARVDPSFQEMEPEEDFLFRKEAWDEYVARLYAEESPLLERLNRLGILAGDLEETFFLITDFPDVDDWPRPEADPPDFHTLAAKVKEYVAHMQSLAPRLPSTWGSDRLIPEYKTLPRFAYWKDLTDPVQLMEVVERFDRSLNLTQGKWVFQDTGEADRETAKAEKNRWDEFREQTARPALEQWYRHRYPAVLETILPAVRVYERLKDEAGKLNYQDLLLKAARLLRDRPEVRRYFRKRFSHLLVDEFQDTDPVQAEVMLLLTASDPRENDWRRCRPVPGSLFVVGDPKQSIYRFRRADIVTYNTVKKIIAESGGEILRLTTNFRTVEGIVDWVNETFSKHFPEESDQYSPAYVSLVPARRRGPETGTPIARLVPRGDSNSEKDRREAEQKQIASTIAKALYSGGRGRTGGPILEGRTYTPDDFLIIPYGKKHLAGYAENLQRLGVPHEVAGGAGVSSLREPLLLRDCLRVLLFPDNPLFLVALLRGELFGIGDDRLYRFRCAGGRFHFRSAVPETLREVERTLFKTAYERLRLYADWLDRLAPTPALEKIADHLGLIAWSAGKEDGNYVAGGFLKILEFVRSRAPDLWSLSDLLETLEAPMAPDADFESVPACPLNRPAVRIMNLHKAKGLEAPVVFLADPGRPKEKAPIFHIDRRGDRVRGYIAVRKRRSQYQSKEIALPADWKEKEEEEKKFLAAEKKRLLYVAATRPRDELVVTEYKNSHWRELTEELKNTPQLDSASFAGTPGPSPVTMDPDEVKTRRNEIRDRWRRITRPSYRELAAKEISVTGKTRSTVTRSMGTEWGNLIHSLLEAAALSPNADLESLAGVEIEERNLPRRMKQEAVEAVRKVRDSDVWNRAMKARRRFVEIPFEVRRDPVTDPQTGEAFYPDLSEDRGAGEPSLLRGVIDLAFEEEREWIILDYKTDTVSEKRVGELFAHYRPQVKTYAAAWEELTGESVREIGIFFIHLGKYLSEKP